MSFELNDSGQKKLEQQLLKKGLKLEALIKKKSPVFTGQYKSLWEAQLNDDGSVSIVNPQGDKGRALEFGGGEGEFPNFSELRKWTRRKLGVTEQEGLDSVTYFIGKKIEDEGVNMQPHIRPAIREFKNREL